MKIVWWKVEKDLHVEEWAVAAPIDDAQLEYGDADHPIPVPVSYPTP